jgi:hypothetical protein
LDNEKGGEVTTDLTLDFHIALDRALLCADCAHIYTAPRTACPSCGCAATSALPLARVLGDRNELVTGLRAFSRLLRWSERSTREVHR